MSNNKYPYKLSIITINYNNLDGLKRTVESVINQIWKEFEYIIIDGGSTDGSTEYIKKTQEHFNYWVSEPDSGIYNAMNKGIKVANGEYLLFLNSGDIFFNNDIIKSVISCLDDRKSKNTIFYGDLMMNGQSTNYPREINFDNFLNQAVPHQAAFIPNELNQLFKYDETYKITADRKFFYQCLKQGVYFRKIQQIIAVFDLTGVSSNTKFNSIRKEEKRRVVREVFNELEAKLMIQLIETKFLLKKCNSNISFWNKIKKKTINIMYNIKLG